MHMDNQKDKVWQNKQPDVNKSTYLITFVGNFYVKSLKGNGRKLNRTQSSLGDYSNRLY